MTSAECQQSFLIIVHVELWFVFGIFISFHFLFLRGAQQRPIFCISWCVSAQQSRSLHFCLCWSDLSFQASTPYSLESESLRVDCIMSGGASPTLALNAVTNKVGRQWRQHNVRQWRIALTNPASETRRAAVASAGLRGRTNNPHECDLNVNEENQRFYLLVICISGMLSC